MNRVTITKEQVDNLIASSKINDVKMGEKTTVVTLTLPNGFVIVESSSCVHPENYDHELGKEICLKHAVDQIWKLEGYRLQCEIYDLRIFAAETGQVSDDCDNADNLQATRIESADIGEIAKVCHEANRSYCLALGDDTQPTWEDAPEWQRKSAITGVVFHIHNPDSKPSNSHESWLKEKQEDGWKYGPIKDAEKKEHPCFVPYDELPKEQKAKDYIFLSIVRSLAG